MNFRDIYAVIPERFRKRGFLVAFSIFFRAVLDFAGVAVLVPVLVQLLEKEGSPWDVVPVAAAALLFIILKSLAVLLLTRFRSRYVFSLYSELSENVLTVFLRKGLLFIRQSNSVDLANKVNAVTMTFISGVILSILNIMSSAVLLVIILTALFIYDPVATLAIIVVMGPLLFSYSYILRKRMKKLGVEENAARRDQSRSVLEFFRGYADYSINDAFSYQMARFRTAVGKVSDVRLNLEGYSAASSGFMEVSVILTVIIIMLMSFSASWKISLSFGIFALSAMKILPSVRAIVGSWQTCQSSGYSIDVLKEILGEGAGAPAGPAEPVVFRDSISLKDVSFRYPGSDREVFSGLNLVVKKGEYVGIRGSSGIGKTTLFNIMMGFYKPDSGGLYVDGELVTPDKVPSWQSMIGYVPQDVFLVNGTFVENIAFGEDPGKADRERIYNILKRVGLRDWIDSLPDRIDTMLAEAGNSISGGQKQRIGIARALYKKASVLFFDEATSSVDIEAEGEINRFISEISSQDSELTVIVIAHRQETLSSCRRIIDLGSVKIKDN